MARDEKFGDPKLLFRVRQLVNEKRAQRAPVNEELVVKHLLVSNREYSRKPQAPFRKSVAKALRCVLDGSSAPPLQRRKRQRRVEGQTDAESTSSDDEAARQGEEAMRSQGGGHNLLNQSMRVGYKKGTDGQDSDQARTPAPRNERGGGGGSSRSALEPRRSAKKARRPGDASSMRADGGGAQDATNVVVERPRERYSDLGGISGVLQEVRELIEYPLVHPEVYCHLGIEPPRGILLHGPPGCGKTLLANAIAGELGVAFLRVSAPEIVSGMSGESEQKVRDLFAAAADAAPAIVFLDEVDAIATKREASARGMEKRIVAQLLTCMDSLGMDSTGGRPVVVIGATNRPNDLDPALRRAGRFDREICLGVPDQEGRARILKVMTSKMRLSGAFDLDEIARRTPGYVGADLSSLTKEAAVVAINRIFGGLRGAVPASNGPAVQGVDAGSGSVASNMNGAGGGSDVSAPADGAIGGAFATAPPAIAAMKAAAESTSAAAAAAAAATALGSPELNLEAGGRARPLTEAELAPLCVTMDDFVAAVRKVQPSAKREGFATAPDVSWSDVGALAEVREELALSLLEPISCPERYEKLGLRMPSGVLLYGPPGCGKTLLAKAVARESGANFISIKGPELLDKYVGESERAVRQVFQRAGASAPCIVFFDELDALCPRRGGGAGGGASSGGGGGESGGVSERVVNQLLTEMDGLDARRGVYVVAATNRPELIDSAMLRPGRLDKLLYVPLPDAHDRVSILKAVSRGVSLAPDVDIEAIAHHPRAEGFSGADLAALVREAGLDVLRRLRVAEAKRGPAVYDEPAAARISASNFESAFARTLPSVSSGDRRFYGSMQLRLRRARAHSQEAPPPPSKEGSAGAPMLDRSES